MRAQRDISRRSFDPAQICETIRRALRHGSLTRLAAFMGFKRQYFSRHFLGQGTGKGVFTEALDALNAMRVKDPDAYLVVSTLISGLLTDWGAGVGHEGTEELICAAMEQMTALLKLRSTPGTRQEQVVASSRLQAVAARLTARLSEAPQVKGRTLHQSGPTSLSERTRDALTEMRKAAASLLMV